MAGFGSLAPDDAALTDLLPPSNTLRSLSGDRRQAGSFNRMPLDPKWDQMPLSSNIEDRRNEPFYRPLLGQVVHGMTGGFDFDRFMMALRHPMTPLPSYLQSDDTSPQMRKDFGVDIGSR